MTDTPTPSPAPRLGGLRVLVTRPAPTAQLLADAIRKGGGDAVAMPALETVATPRPEVLAQPMPAQAVHLAIFISVPAVTHGSWLLDEGWIRPQGIAAIGASTAAALHAHGHTVHVTPQTGTFTSEALLRHPALQDDRVRGDVLIVRGHGGRELLATSLRERGARVSYVQVYQRQRPSQQSAAAAREILRCTGAAHIITATSLEILDNALLLLGPEADTARTNSRVLVPSDRIAQATATAGFRLPPLRSRGADNQALLSAMEAWWGTRNNTADKAGAEGRGRDDVH